MIDAGDKRQIVFACGCLLALVASCCCVLLPVTALLFMIGGAPVIADASMLPTSTPVASHLDQSPTPNGAQAADNPAVTPDKGALPSSADPVSGKQLFNAFQPAAGIACATCHRVDSEERLVGPGLLNVGIRARTRIAGLSAVEYLHQSIVSPSAYVVEGYADLMPKNWGKVFSEKQIDDLIAYLLTLKGK